MNLFANFTAIKDEPSSPLCLAQAQYRADTKKKGAGHLLMHNSPLREQKPLRGGMRLPWVLLIAGHSPSHSLFHMSGSSL